MRRLAVNLVCWAAATVPPYAVGPALITVGALMMMNVMRVRWEHAAEALPCFLTMVLMPMTYSITNGELHGSIRALHIQVLFVSGESVVCLWRECRLSLARVLFVSGERSWLHQQQTQSPSTYTRHGTEIPYPR